MRDHLLLYVNGQPARVTGDDAFLSLSDFLRRRRGLTITIGGENADPRLAGFTLVTSSYRAGDLSGVIGVMGPTRMPYDKIVSLVNHTSLLVEGLLA